MTDDNKNGNSVAEALDEQIQQLVSVDRVILNVSQSVIVTTEDKLKLALQSHMSEVDGNKDWIAPLSLSIALIMTLVTADFKDLILTKDTWRAIFIISSFLSFGWLLFALKKAFKRKSLESLIKEIKSSL